MLTIKNERKKDNFVVSNVCLTWTYLTDNITLTSAIEIVTSVFVVYN